MSASREQFSSKLGFILAAAGSAVGIGNLVGFPVNAAKNGGGSKLCDRAKMSSPLPWLEFSLKAFNRPAKGLAKASKKPLKGISKASKRTFKGWPLKCLEKAF